MDATYAAATFNAMRGQTAARSLLCALSALALLGPLQTTSCSGKAQIETSNAGMPGELAGGTAAGGGAIAAGGTTGEGGVAASAGSLHGHSGAAGCQATVYTSLSGACTNIGESVPFKAVADHCQLLGGPQKDCPDKTCLCKADGTWWCGCPCFSWLNPPDYMASDGSQLLSPGVSCSCVNDTATCIIADSASGGDGGVPPADASAGAAGARSMP